MAEDALMSLQDQAYRAMRRNIIFLSYKPGQKLVLKHVCDDLQVGRTPVRESIVRLQQEGLVGAIPQSGTYVSKISLAAAESARFVREHLEREVAIECCARATRVDIDALDRAIALQEEAARTHSNGDFFISDNLMHQAIFDIAGRSEVWSWLSTTNADLERYRWLRIMTEGLAWDSILQQHHRIREAIVRHDPMETSYLISLHLHMMFDDQSSVIQEYSDYFADNAPA